MNPVASLITLDGIALDADAPSRKRAFEELSLLFEKTAGVPHREAFEALNARERLGCTALGGGVAVPHGRIKDLDRILIAVLRTKTPVVFDTPDSRRARLFFGILIPENDEDNYLSVLAYVAGLLKDRTVKEALLNETDPVKVCQTISEYEPQPEAVEPEAEDASNDQIRGTDTDESKSA